jgi:hypothetical protein
MTPEEFKSELGKAGFTEFVVVEWPADGMAALHSHPFEARALILSGEITLLADGSEHCFRPGEVSGVRLPRRAQVSSSATAASPERERGRYAGGGRCPDAAALS